MTDMLGIVLWLAFVVGAIPIVAFLLRGPD